MNLKDFFDKYAGEEVEMQTRQIPIGGGRTYPETTPKSGSVLDKMQEEAKALGIKIRFNFVDPEVAVGGSTDIDPDRHNIPVQKDLDGVYRIGEYEEQDDDYDYDGPL